MNVCLLLLRVLVCMRLKKIDFCCQLGTSSYVSCPTLYMFHHLCSPVSSNPSDGLQPPRFQPWTMTLSSWWLVSSGGILSTTLWIQTFSTDHLHSAISNRMTSTSAAFPVFLLLFCMLFPRFLILWAAFTVILLETLRNRPLQETAKHTILYPCSLPSRLCTSGLLLSCDSTQFSSHGTFSSIVTSVLDCLDTRTSSLVVD